MRQIYHISRNANSRSVIDAYFVIYQLRSFIFSSPGTGWFFWEVEYDILETNALQSPSAHSKQRNASQQSISWLQSPIFEADPRVSCFSAWISSSRDLQWMQYDSNHQAFVTAMLKRGWDYANSSSQILALFSGTYSISSCNHAFVHLTLDRTSRILGYIPYLFLQLQ